MATITMTAPTLSTISIETAGSDTVLAVRFEHPRPARDARRLSQTLAGLRMPGIEGVDVVGDTVLVSFEPGTITRSHLDLLLHDAAQHLSA